jgi:hypothetical protein
MNSHHALMLIGADEITTIESGGFRTIRTLEHILTLYGADPKAWGMVLPSPIAMAVVAILSLPVGRSWPPSGVFFPLSLAPTNDALRSLRHTGLRRRRCPL